MLVKLAFSGIFVFFYTVVFSRTFIEASRSVYYLYQLSMCESEKLAEQIEANWANRIDQIERIELSSTVNRANRMNRSSICWANHKLAERIERITNQIKSISWFARFTGPNICESDKYKCPIRPSLLSTNHNSKKVNTNNIIIIIPTMGNKLNLAWCQNYMSL